MKICKSISDARKVVSQWRSSRKTIGLVPTMGFLHEGHQSLIEQASLDNDEVIVSIFVNPMQFSENEDFDTYPQDFEQDVMRSESAGATMIFYPSASEIYPQEFNTYVRSYGVSELLEGSSRPMHFQGVTTVVTKLFNIFNPDRAYFGQKDAQQVAVINQMVRDLNQDVEIIDCPIIREIDGLAKSSRNSYLSQTERKAATILSEALAHVHYKLFLNEKNVQKLLENMKVLILSEPLAKIDYIEIVDLNTLQKVEFVNKDILVLVAVYIGKTRLIDNIKFFVD